MGNKRNQFLTYKDGNLRQNIIYSLEEFYILQVIVLKAGV